MASSVTTASQQDFSQSRVEALQALVNSISPKDASSPGQKKLSSDQVKKISDKLGELLGDSDIGELAGIQKRNEKGELLNEEGLPIIDIVEPLKGDTSQARTQALVASPPIFDDPDLLPPWALSSAEKARRKAEREHILDLLEEEERIDREREDILERERWRAELEKRKEAAKAELESLRKARELQKKMGKALLRNVIVTKERTEKESQQEVREWTEQKEQEQEKLKKSVSFADAPGSDADETFDKSRQRGDVALARLRTGKTSLLTHAQMEKQPMKMDVVERYPGAVRTEPLDQAADVDSDDESVPGSPVAANADEGGVIHLDADSDERPPHESPSSDSDTTDVEQMSDGGEPVAWQDEDFDYAQHQREVALAYYEKRATIGLEAYSAMRAHSHDEDGHEWDRPEVPLDATLASAPPKPSTSRFRSERATERSSSTLASHSLGPSVLPSSQTSDLKKAVRMGKLEHGQLVGEDSDDDVAQEAKEIMELLSRGDIANVGPQTSMIVESPSFRPLALTLAPNMIVDSPSFSPPVVSSQPRAGRGPKPSMISKLIDSPTFTTSVGTSAQPPGFQSLVLDSTSSLNSTVAQSREDSIPRSTSFTTSRVSVDARRPGVVMTAEVKESVPPTPRGDTVDSTGKEKRVSKFKTERR